jgi:hypothetical protein
VLPPPIGSPVTGGQPQTGGSPVAVPGASPAAAIAAAPPAAAGAAGPPVPRGGASSVTVTAGQATDLRCLDDRVQIQADAGGLPPQTILTCRPIEPGSVPTPPGPFADDTVFELTSSPGTSTSLAGKLDLTVTYPASIPLDQREKLTLLYLNGKNWEPIADQSPDPDETAIGARVDRPGVYALYQHS